MTSSLQQQAARGQDVARLRVALVLLCLWGATRGAMLFLLLWDREASALSDVHTYLSWAEAAWQDGVLPGRDVDWEYPPGALPLVLLPVEGFGRYLAAFSVLVLCLDLVVLGLLVGTRRAGDWTGVAVWLAFPVLLGPVFLTRFDLAPAALVAFALAVALRRPAAAGAALALAAAIKLWPLLVLAPALALVTARRKLLLGVIGAGAVVGAAAWSAGVLGAFVTASTYQGQRGLQVEAVAATPYLWLRVLGGADAPVYRFGAWEVPASSSLLVADAVTILGGVAVVALLLWVWRTHRDGRSADLGLATCTLLTIVIVSNKALSPQYLVWLGAALAVTCARPFPLRSRVVGLLLATAALTHLVYPLLYVDLLDGSVGPLVVLTARNLAVVVLLSVLLRACLARPRQPALRDIQRTRPSDEVRPREEAACR